MRSQLALATAGTLFVLAGCTDVPVARSDAASTPPSAVSPPLDLIGTWTDAAGGGFIAIGAKQVVVSLDGVPRLVLAPVENAIEPGMSAGKIGLAGGAALFVARGASPVGGGVLVDHLDVDVVAADGSSARRRLHSELAMRMAARVAQAPAPTPPPSPAPQAAPVDGFLAAVPMIHVDVARELLRRAQQGAGEGELAALFAEQQRRTYAEVLGMLQQARSLPPAQAGLRLLEADRRRGDAEAFRHAYQAWRSGRG